MERVRRGLGISVLAGLAGCSAYVGPGGPDVAVAAPNVYVGGVWGGGYVGPGRAHAYAHRGFASRHHR